MDRLVFFNRPVDLIGRFGAPILTGHLPWITRPVDGPSAEAWDASNLRNTRRYKFKSGRTWSVLAEPDVPGFVEPQSLTPGTRTIFAANPPARGILTSNLGNSDDWKI